MAWGDPTTLKFDVDKITSMRTKLQNTAEELGNFKTKLLEELEILKTDWRTPAGEEFMTGFDNDWAKQVDKYRTIIYAVDELLAVAETDYAAVEEKAKAISF